MSFVAQNKYISKPKLEDYTMSREVRRVPANWEHPKDEKGHYIPYNEHFPYNEEDTKLELRGGFLSGEPPNYGFKVMPQWPKSERTHYQMYESVTEGTPISPVMESPEELARWLTDNKASGTATYNQWLAVINKGSTVSLVVNCTTGEILGGVEAIRV